MPNDSFTKVTHQSWFSRMGKSFMGIFIGLIVVAISFPLLFWNEGNAVRTAKGLEEGASGVISIDTEKIDPAHDQTLVHGVDTAATNEVLTDPVFNIGENAIAFRRTVEMYQWHEDQRSETRTKVGGGTETVTTYDYRKDWSERVINSNRFERRQGHENPSSMPYEAYQAHANHVRLGAFTLPKTLLQQLHVFEPLIPDENLLNSLPNSVRERAHLEGNRLYIGESPASPQLGDVRIGFSAIKPMTVSVIAKQSGNTFEPYQTQYGSTINFLYAGTHSAESMFEAEQQKNENLTWMLRIGGIIAMFIGFTMIFKPLAVFADVIPFVGRFVRLGTGLVAASLTITLSFTTIAISWLFYRPLIGVPLLLVVGATIYGVISLIRKQRQKSA